jgi:sorting nexin-9/18/33
MEFTSEMLTTPSLFSPDQSRHDRAGSRGSLTPRNSPKSGQTALPLQPQTTGEWSYFPSFRQSLLGGKTLNRFSSFVTSGAEDWVLKGTLTDLPATATQEPPSMDCNDEEEEEEENDKENQDPELCQPNRHFIDHGPAWKPKLPGFRVMVHSPSKRSSVISGSYTIYLVTSIFLPAEAQSSLNENLASPTRITVHRRFSHFVFLHTALTRCLPGITLPPLPEKQYAGRFSQEFVEARRGDLERYLSRVIRHPVARYAEVLTFFLGCESETVRLLR